MSKQTIASAKKDFWSSHSVSLASYPVACNIANITLFGELFLENKIIVYGKYDLIFCYPKGEDISGSVYDTKVTTCTFCENLSLTGSRISGPLPGAIEVSPRFSRPPRVHIRASKPSTLKIWDLIKSVISYTTWVEVQVEGEIVTEITTAQENVQEFILTKPAEEKKVDKEQSDKKKLEPPEKDNPDFNYKQAEKPQEVKAGELSEKDGNIEQREEQSQESTEKKACNLFKKELKTLESENKKNQSVDPEILAEMVMGIIHRREEERVLQRELIQQEPEKKQPFIVNPIDTGVKIPYPVTHPSSLKQTPMRSVRQNTFLPDELPEKPGKALSRTDNPADTNVMVPNPEYYSSSLDQIPSRPGLHKTFTQYGSMPSSPGIKGLDSGAEPSSWMNGDSLLKKIPQYPSDKPGTMKTTRLKKG